MFNAVSIALLVAVIASVSAFAPKFASAKAAQVNVDARGNTMKMAVELPPLPYDYTALEPHIGEETLKIHHDKHHAKYVTVTNSMIAGTELEGSDVVTILRKAHGENQGLFNNAAQSWNHAFYWECMKSGGGGAPTGKVAELIEKYLGGYEKFKADFATAGNTAFGSGW
jgi:Fe-Mn family superoxide dismutase